MPKLIGDKPLTQAERQKRYYEKNREKILAKGRESYAKNLEKSRSDRRKRVQEWRKRNPTRGAENAKAYAKAHPEAKRLSEQKRRIRKLNNGEFQILAKETNRLLSSPCANCGSKADITLDHIIPISRGGRHSIGNLQSLCRPCNSSKNAKTIMEWRVA